MKGDKDKKGKRSWRWTSCRTVPVTVTESSQAFMWLSSHFSYPLPSVWSGWPWSPKSRSSHLKIRLSFLLLWNVECSCTEKESLPHNLLVTTCFSLFETWLKCLPRVAGHFSRHRLALASAWLNVRASALASVSVLTKTMWWAGWWRERSLWCRN